MSEDFFSYPTATPKTYTVSQLNATARFVLEEGFPQQIWVEGELSNLARPASGHYYFSLKDAKAQVRCAMFRMKTSHLNFRPENGMQVLARAKVGLYEGRGDFQLIVEYMEESGDGALRRAFDILKNKLEAEGLFSSANKQEIPEHPESIGVITSPSGAAIQDILSVCKRRFPATKIVIYAVPVQGDEAAGKIAKMIHCADRRQECDVLLLARGGGSLEDLWAFNDERVARAMSECSLPIVTGIGHEVDFTIADFVADERAPTPSAGAELLTPNQEDWQQHLLRFQQRLSQLITKHIHTQQQTLLWLDKRLSTQHPAQKITQQVQRLDELELRLIRAHDIRIRDSHSRLKVLHARLNRHTPGQLISNMYNKQQQLTQRLNHAMRSQLDALNANLSRLTATLDVASPLATLARGYAVVTYRKGRSEHVVQHASDVSIGNEVKAQLKDGHIICTVKKTFSDST